MIRPLKYFTVITIKLKGYKLSGFKASELMALLCFVGSVDDVYVLKEDTVYQGQIRSKILSVVK